MTVIEDERTVAWFGTEGRIKLRLVSGALFFGYVAGVLWLDSGEPGVVLFDGRNGVVRIAGHAIESWEV